MEYTIPTAIKDDTFDGVRWTINVNNAPLDLTGALIEMRITVCKKIVLFSTQTGNEKLKIIAPPTSGIFELSKHIISLSTGNYPYEMVFTLQDGTVKTYFHGTWLITEN